MRTVILEEIQIDCDFCGGTVGNEENTIELKGSGLDRGVPVGPAYKSGKYDCCFKCYSAFIDLMAVLRREKAQDVQG